MLFAIALTSSTLLNWLLLGAVGALGVGFLVRKDTGIEERRRRMIDLAGEMKKLGLDELAEGFISYSVGDYSGVVGDVKSLVKQLANPEQALALLARAFYKQLPERLRADGDRERILKHVGDFLVANPEVRSKVLSDFDKKVKELASAGQ